jgi:hypothetical protein
MTDKGDCGLCIHKDVCFIRIYYFAVEELETFELSKDFESNVTEAVKRLGELKKCFYKFRKVCPYYLYGSEGVDSEQGETIPD